MTHADVPYLASKDLTGAKNPFTGRPLYRDKSEKILVSSFHAWQAPNINLRRWNIKDSEWLYVSGDMYDISNWSIAPPPPPAQINR
jgi:hypothetical protein